ncbi:MAG: DUF4352 domain-containing protein [Chloroflexi bacterium]|nr:DUF4352 domain-containing protein [Chloroflexota bacterium]
MKKILMWVVIVLVGFVAIVAVASRVGRQQEITVAPNTVNVGQPVTVGEIKWTAVNPETKSEILLDNDPSKAIKADGMFVIIDLTAQLTGEESAIVDSSQFAILDSKGRIFKAAAKFGVYSDLDPIFLKQVTPKAPATGKVIFDVPADARGLKLEIDDLRFKSRDKGYVDLGI